ncbi:MAG: PD-(D/E)XK nuclease family protein [Terracidiphilus sp.]|jgi:probable DNA repair protein
MGQEPEAEPGSAVEPGLKPEIDGWLRNGGLVVTASDRAARALAAAFHRARRAEGFLAWPAPDILDWKSFVRAAWEERSRDGRLLLNAAQEQSLWAEIAGADGRLATLLEGPRHRIAALAMEAHELLCGYAPQFLRPSARAAWQQDAEAFSNWLAAFDQTCRDGNLLSGSRLPLELIPLLENDRLERPPLLLAGFDRILPTQRAFFDAWGEWRQAAPGLTAPGALGKPDELDEQTEPAKPPAQVFFHQAADAQAELAACALWCGERLAANPRARLLVITLSAGSQPSRGQIERAFLKLTGAAGAPLFEFSLGVPLSQAAHARAALLLLRWLTGPLAEHELDWLFSTGQIAANPQETSALQERMHALRRRGLERPEWSLNAFIQQRTGSDPPPTSWVNRIAEAQRRLADLARRPQTPLDWAELVPQLLETAGWPGPRPLSSAEFQAVRRFEQAVEAGGSLGFDGRRVVWADFLAALARILDETLFAPESQDAPIQIAGPAESAGLTADAVWFLGANEDAWPAGGATHPLLPPELQRQAAMPHASPQLDWDLAQAITARILASAPEIHFSYARQIEGIEARPSRLIAQLAGAPRELAQALPRRQPLTVSFEDSSRIPFPPGKVKGGTGVLTSQSQCPFKAFASARLAAEGWEPAEAGLTPSQRGQLLHAVLHAVWGGPPNGIRSQHELQDLTERSAFVAAHVRRVLEGELLSALRQRMPRRYLELEEQRLTGLVAEWLDYEAARIGFEVAETEAERTIHLAGLTFDLRLDRIDRLIDGSLLVIDYKSGIVSPKSWELPRPDDVQLPLYAGFALDGELGGLVFAKVRAGDLAFAGHVGNPAATLFAGLKSNSALAKNALTAEQLTGWRQRIEQLARDFLAGRAEVDPREAPKTCERCGLQTLCRILESENQSQLEDEDDTACAEAADE